MMRWSAAVVIAALTCWLMGTAALSLVDVLAEAWRVSR